MTLDELLKDPAFREIVGQFVANLPRRLEAIEGAARLGDARQVHRLAHQLAGSGGGFGFAKLSRHATVVSRISAATDPGMADAIEKLKAEADLIAYEWADGSAAGV